MIEVGTRELKNRLGQYLQIARRGGRVIILSNGTPVAQIVSLQAGEGGDDEAIDLARLASMAGVTPPRHTRVQEP